MHDYFKPWRRKLGVALLLVSTTFTSAWMASRTYYLYTEFNLSPSIGLGLVANHEYLAIGFCLHSPYNEFERFECLLETNIPNESIDDYFEGRIHWLEPCKTIGGFVEPGGPVRIYFACFWLPMLVAFTLAPAVVLLTRPQRSRSLKRQDSEDTAHNPNLCDSSGPSSETRDA